MYFVINNKKCLRARLHFQQQPGQGSQTDAPGGGNSGWQQGKVFPKKKVEGAVKPSEPAGVGLMAYAKVICFSCGERGHHVEACDKPKICFICKAVNHKVDGCPMRRKAHI